MAVGCGFETIDDACLANILKHVDVETLLETAMEHPRSRWTRVMRNHGVWRDAFVRKWKVAELHLDDDTLERAAFYLHATLEDFRKVHHVSRYDSLASVAVRHGIDCTTLKSSNNLFNEQSLHCRSKIYIPIQDECQLIDKEVSVEKEEQLKRYLLLVAEPTTTGAQPSHQDERHLLPCPIADSEESLKLLAETMQRSLRIDLNTCRYYLLNNGRNLARAIVECQEDADWEATNTG